MKKKELGFSDLLELLATDKTVATYMAHNPIQCLKDLGIELSESSKSALLMQTSEKRKERISEAVFRGDEDGVTCCSVFGFHYKS
jgi:hypothetical protein